MVKDDDEALMGDVDDDLLDDEPIPARRDTSIFKRGKEEHHKEKKHKEEKEEKKEEFDEDVFV